MSFASCFELPLAVFRSIPPTVFCNVPPANSVSQMPLYFSHKCAGQSLLTIVARQKALNALTSRLWCSGGAAQNFDSLGDAIELIQHGKFSFVRHPIYRARHHGRSVQGAPSPSYGCQHVPNTPVWRVKPISGAVASYDN